MKICVCMFYNDAIKIYSDLTKQINAVFSYKYGFDFHVETKRKLIDRHPAWERVPLIIELLQKDYDYIIYIDADAFFRIENGDKLLPLIQSYDQYDIILSGDITELFNTGFMIIKRCNFTRNLFWKLMISQEFKDMWVDRTWEQRALIILYQRNYLKFKRRAFIFQYGVLQSYVADKYPLSIIVHFENRRLKDKLIKILNQYEKYEKMNVLNFDNVNYVTYI